MAIPVACRMLTGLCSEGRKFDLVRGEIFEVLRCLHSPWTSRKIWKLPDLNDRLSTSAVALYKEVNGELSSTGTCPGPVKNTIRHVSNIMSVELNACFSGFAGIKDIVGVFFAPRNLLNKKNMRM